MVFSPLFRSVSETIFRKLKNPAMPLQGNGCHRLETHYRHSDWKLSGGKIGIRKQVLSSFDADESAPTSEVVRNQIRSLVGESDQRLFILQGIYRLTLRWFLTGFFHYLPLPGIKSAGKSRKRFSANYWESLKPGLFYRIWSDSGC